VSQLAVELLKLRTGIDLTRVKSLLRQPVLVDMRNVYNPAEMTEAGFRYTSIGRP